MIFLNQTFCFKKWAIMVVVAMYSLGSVGYATYSEYLHPKNHPYIVTGKYCGAYVTWYTLRHYGLSRPIDLIVGDLKLEAKDFTNVYEITSMLKSYGISSRAVKLEPNKISSINKPFIPYLSPRNQNQFGHFVLCIPSGNGKAVILDGKEEPVIFELEELEKRDPRATGWDGTSILIEGVNPNLPSPNFLSTTSAFCFFGFFLLVVALLCRKPKPTN